MSHPTCQTCPYFQADEGTPDGPGECHRNAPLPINRKDLGAWWPLVEVDDWCGEHPLARENVRSLMAAEAFRLLKEA